MASENDIILIYFKDKPLVYARVESITADHKPNWYHVKLLLLSLPLQVVTWILRDSYISGDEFTMNGDKMRLEKVVSPKEPETTLAGEKKEIPLKNGRKTKVISLNDLKKQL